jgi:hypothetical protein
MNAGRSLVLILGIVVLIGNAASVVRVLIVPRPPASGPTTWSTRAIRFGFRQFAGLTRSYVTKDRVLAFSEPVALLGLLATWLVISVIGFGLVVWGLNDLSIGAAFAQSGSSVFTLGFDTDRHTGGRAVDFVAAGTGMVLVALQIAYLPTLYGAYNRRETLVTLLESRAGAPAWGPEVLIRHQLVGLIDNLPGLFADWEQWSADVTESHTSYPSLLYFRSPRSHNSWVVSIIAVLDAAALSLALDPDGAPKEARMCVRMGFTCLRDIAQVSRINYDPDPSPDSDIELPRSEFDAAVERLDEVGYPITRSPDDAWAHFKGWRVNYESTGYALAQLVDAPPARWTGPRRLFHGESLEPARPVDRQPGGAPPGVFARRARTTLPSGDPPWSGKVGPGNRHPGDPDRNGEPGDPDFPT